MYFIFYSTFGLQKNWADDTKCSFIPLLFPITGEFPLLLTSSLLLLLLLLLLLSHFSHVQLCATHTPAHPGSPVPGILQARTLEWVAISFSNAWKWKVKVKLISHARPSATPWTAAFQAPPSRGFSRPRVLEWGAIATTVVHLLQIGESMLIHYC